MKRRALGKRSSLSLRLARGCPHLDFVSPEQFARSVARTIVGLTGFSELYREV